VGRAKEDRFQHLLERTTKEKRVESSYGQKVETGKKGPWNIRPKSTIYQEVIGFGRERKSKVRGKRNEALGKPLCSGMAKGL